MKALDILNEVNEQINRSSVYGYYVEIQFNKAYQTIIGRAIEELEALQKEKALLEEYVQFARLHIETYRCKCGSLGRVGYLCSNKECSEV